MAAVSASISYKKFLIILFSLIIFSIIYNGINGSQALEAYTHLPANIITSYPTNSYINPHQNKTYHIHIAPTTPKLLIYGVMTVARKYDIRMLIRSSYRYQKAWQYGIMLLFFIGVPPNRTHLPRMQIEKDTYGDMVILGIKENQNKGKVFDYLRYIHNWPEKYADYKFIGKYDDDTVMNYYKHYSFLSTFKHQNDSYYGLCIKTYKKRWTWNVSSIIYLWNTDRLSMYMGGLGYGMSNDILPWIVSDKSYAYHHRGSYHTEDALTTRWMVEDQKGLNTHCYHGPHYDAQTRDNGLNAWAHGRPFKTYYGWYQQIKTWFPEFEPLPNQSWYN
eukprot:147913_1